MPEGVVGATVIYIVTAVIVWGGYSYYEIKKENSGEGTPEQEDR